MAFDPELRQKKIGRTTYFWSTPTSQVFEIKGPYRPGNVWKLEVYELGDRIGEFLKAWVRNELTPVQRRKITKDQDRVLAAMTMGSTNQIDPELIGKSKCLGYTIKRKKDCIEMMKKQISEKISK